MPSAQLCLRPAFRAARAGFSLAILSTSLSGQSIYTPYRFTTVAGQAGAKGGSTDGPVGVALFSDPEGIAIDGTGNLYIADSGNSTIRKISPSGTVTTLAGTAGVGGHADGVGPAAQFYYPTGLAVDTAGNVYVADSSNNRIRKVSPGGMVTTLAGGAGTSLDGSGYADGTGTGAAFDFPNGITVDAAGNLFVADWGNNAIRKVTPGGVVTTLAGNPKKTFPPSALDGTGSGAQFNLPEGLAVDAVGNVYVADTTNDTIRKVTPGGVVTTLAGAAGNAGTFDAAGGAARFYGPWGVAVDKVGNVYVTDRGNATVRRISPSGAVTTIAGSAPLPLSFYSTSPDGIGPAAHFSQPAAVAVASDGTVYVADSQANTIRRGTFVGPSTATVILGNLTHVGAGPASVTTIPAGLHTTVSYSGGVLSESTNGVVQPAAQGTYGVFANITDPGYTGYANGLLTVEPSPADQPLFTVQHMVPGGSHLWAITFGPSGFVAVGTGGTILKSGDGITWENQDSGTDQWLVGVVWGGNQYVAVGDKGTVLISPDAAAWTRVVQTATTARLNNVTFGAGVFVAVGEGGTIISSPDARTWTARASGVTGWLRGLAWIESDDHSGNIIPRDFPARFVASGEGGPILSSSDGLNWTSDDVGNGLAALVAGQNIEALAPGANQIIGVGDAGALDFSAIGYDDFFPYEYLVTNSFFAPVAYRAVVQGLGGVFAAGDGGTILKAGLAASIATWYQIPSGTSSDLAGGIAIGSSVYFVGDNETIVEASTPSDSRLVNLSCRTQVGNGADTLIVGFVLRGGVANGATPMLIRGSGPALAAFDVQGALSDPVLDLFGNSYGSLPIGTNSGWGGSASIASAAASVGAFAWPDPSSHDDALLEILPAGPYTANISSQSGDTGIALAEVYDATPSGSESPDSPRLVNLAARSQVGTGSGVLIAGFVIGGTTPRQILIRASGPSLAAFGISGAIPDPKLQVFYGGQSPNPVIIRSNTGWSGDPAIASTAALVGAFSWNPASADSALLITLGPGAYTAEVSGAGGDTGIALIEIYEVP